jgi:ornithine cyclodeaminase
MDGNHITTIRTGAGGAVACELFAAPDARTLAVIGTGVQGVIQTEAALHARPSIREVRCFNPHGPVTERYRRAFEARVQVRVTDGVAAAVEGADVVITATPSTEPLVSLASLAPHAHVNAVGSDTVGKRELEPAVLRAAEVFVDDPAQSRSIGELQGLDDVPAVAIGDVLRGAHPGRQKRGVTVFDSTGISLQDLTTAWRAYQMATEQGIGARLVW